MSTTKQTSKGRTPRAKPARRFRPITEEKWGQRLARLRVEAGLTGRDAGAILVEYGYSKDLGPAMLSRLERFTAEVPSDLVTRQRCTLLCLAYGVDPADMGLDVRELPAVHYERALSQFGYTVTRRYQPSARQLLADTAA